MVDEAERQHQPALLVHQGKAPRAQVVVVAVVAHAELLFAAQRRDRHDLGKLRIAGGLHAVFHPVALGVELGVDRPVIALERIEIAVRERDHLAARHRRDHFAVQDRFVPIAAVLELDAAVGLAHDQHLALGNRARFVDLEPQREGRFLDRFDHRAKVTNLSRVNIGEAQLVVSQPLDRAPDAVADLQHHVVFTMKSTRTPRQPGVVADIQRGEELIEFCVKTLAVHNLSRSQFFLGL